VTSQQQDGVSAARPPSPFKARAVFGRTVTLRIIAVVEFSCVAFNVPSFFDDLYSPRNTVPAINKRK